jgi:hypothetical protein
MIGSQSRDSLGRRVVIGHTEEAEYNGGNGELQASDAEGRHSRRGPPFFVHLRHTSDATKDRWLAHTEERRNGEKPRTGSAPPPLLRSSV